MAAAKKVSIDESPATLLMAEFGVEIVNSASRELPYLIERLGYGHFKCNACQREFRPLASRYGQRREGTLNFGLASHAKSHILKGEAMDGYRETPGEYSGGYQYHRCLPSRERCLAIVAAQTRKAEIEPEAENMAAAIRPMNKLHTRLQRERETLEQRAVNMMRAGHDLNITAIPNKISELSAEIKRVEQERDAVEARYPADVAARAWRMLQR